MKNKKIKEKPVIKCEICKCQIKDGYINYVESVISTIHGRKFENLLAFISYFCDKCKPPYKRLINVNGVNTYYANKEIEVTKDGKPVK